MRILLMLLIASLIAIPHLDAAEPTAKKKPILEFRIATQSPSKTASTQMKVPVSAGTLYVENKPIATQMDIALAEAATDGNDQPVIKITFTKQGGKKILKATKANLKNYLVVIFQGKIVVAPRIQAAIGEKATIAGNFTQANVDKMVAAIKASPDEKSNSM